MSPRFIDFSVAIARRRPKGISSWASLDQKDDSRSKKLVGSCRKSDSQTFEWNEIVSRCCSARSFGAFWKKVTGWIRCRTISATIPSPIKGDVVAPAHRRARRARNAYMGRSPSPMYHRAPRQRQLHCLPQRPARSKTCPRVRHRSQSGRIPLSRESQPRAYPWCL
jgi:hypothetical protein